MYSGEDKAWNILKTLDPAAVCRNALVNFDISTGLFVMKSFGMDIYIDAGSQYIHSDAPEGNLLLERLGYFSKLSILWYLTSVRGIPLSGRLVQPVNLKGGQIFFRGTHVLPLDKLAARYRDDVGAFLKRGKYLGGEQVNYGDAAVRLFPFPRVPVVILFWREDEEFPARADLLFDSSCEYHLALDILWSTAMKSILIMM